MTGDQLLAIARTAMDRPWRISGFRIVAPQGSTVMRLDPYDSAADGQAMVKIMNHATALATLVRACEGLKAAREQAWRAVTDGEIHRSQDAIAHMGLEVIRALAAVHAIPADGAG